LDGAINAPEEPGIGVQPPNEQCMLRIDTAVQLTVHCYYRVLGYKSEGGTGDTQINQNSRNACPEAHAKPRADSHYLGTGCLVARVTR